MQILAHNILAQGVGRELNITMKRREKSGEKLSSGYRINRAADDAAGLAISEKMRKQIRGLTRGIRNTQDGVSVCQVADGALAEVNDMLHRLTELSVQSANGTNSDEDRQYIQEEINKILQEIDRIGETTTFDELQLFSETSRTGAGSDNHVLSREQAIRELLSGNFSVGKKDITIAGQVLPQDTVTRLAQGYSTEYLWYHYQDICKDPAQRGEVTRTFQLMTQNMRGYMIGAGYGSDGSQRYTQDEIDVMADLVSRHITKLASGQYTNVNDAQQGFWYSVDNELKKVYAKSVTSQVGNFANLASEYYVGTPNDSWSAVANQAGMVDYATRQILYDNYGFDFANTELAEICFPFKSDTEDPIERYRALADMEAGKNESSDANKQSGIWIQSGYEAGDGMWLQIAPMNTNILGIDGLDVSTQSGAEHALSMIDEALQRLSESRSVIGAQQNRLEHTIANEENIVENTSAAESQIRDTDMASEMERFSKDNILMQVGQAMMAQANQQSQGILQLLQ